MAEFDDNAEMATLSRWWSKNGMAAILGVVIGLLVLGGWYAWGWYSNRQEARAADMFAQVQQGLSTNNLTGGIKNIAATLKDDYSGTPYAAAAALSLASYYVDADQLDPAAKQLDWAMNNADSEGMRQVATVRKARVLWSQNQSKQALDLLDREHPDAFEPLYGELIGDIHAARGDRKAAYKAYQNALAQLPDDAPRQMLQQKMSQTAPVSVSNDTPSDSNKSDS